MTGHSEEELKILLHDEVQLLDWGDSRTAGPWIKLRLKDTDQLDVFRDIDVAKGKAPRHIINATLSLGDIVQLAEPKKGPYGEQARVLRTHPFLLYAAQYVGPDPAYQAWVRTKPCAVTHGPPPSEYAHVRDVSKGAGVGIKPTYSGIPLCRHMHELQHQKGIVALYDAAHEHHGTAMMARTWLEQLSERYLRDWVWETLKHQLGYETWSQVPPKELLGWALVHEIADLLPDAYVNYVEGGS